MVITQNFLYPTLFTITKFKTQVSARSFTNNKIGGSGKTVEVDDVDFLIY